MVGKRLQKRKFIGQMKQKLPEMWVSEEEMRKDLEFLEKLHPYEIDNAIQALADKKFIHIRFTSDGKREFQFNQESVQTALNKIPPEQRGDYAINIYEDVAILCEYNNEITTLLSVIIQQTDYLIECKEAILWITKSHGQLGQDVIGITKDLRSAFNYLEAKNFVEVAENGPTQYRYRLRITEVQAAINALQSGEEEAGK